MIRTVTAIGSMTMFFALAAIAGATNKTTGLEDVLQTAKALEDLCQARSGTPLAKCKTAWDIAGKLAHNGAYKIDDRVALLEEIAEFEKATEEVVKIAEVAFEKKYLVLGASITLGPELKALVDQRRLSPDDLRTVRGMITSLTEILLRLPQMDVLKESLANVVLTGLDEDWKAVKDSQNYERMASVLESYRRQIEAVMKLFPDKPALKDLLDWIDAQSKEIQAELAKAVAAKEWPGNFKDFAGPGEADKLAASCMDYFRKSSNWGARKEKPEVPLAVAIRGNWISVRKNLIDETTQWGLPITLAVRRDWGDDEGKDLAVVFEIIMLTQDERGVQKAPPWSGITVGNITKMKRSKIPSADAGGKEAAAAAGGK